ncbi:MAG: helix-turn-helix transcriptional regulator, partial [Pseudomonas sp.]
MDPAFEQLIALCYECIVDKSAWLPMLDKLMQVTGRQQGVLLSWDQRSAGAQVSETSICDTSTIALYNSTYNVIDPGKLFMANRPVGSWYHDVEEMGERRIARDPYYQEFHRPQGMLSTSCIKLYEQELTGSYLSLFTNRDAGFASAAQQALLERITPHLLRAGKIIDKLGALHLELDKRDLLLDQHSAALWLVDGSGKCLHRNSAAEREMLAPQCVLMERNTRLGMRSAADSFVSALKKATALRGAQASYLDIGNGNKLLVLPVAPRQSLLRGVVEPIAMLVLAKPGSGKALAAEL